MKDLKFTFVRCGMRSMLTLRSALNLCRNGKGWKSWRHCHKQVFIPSTASVVADLLNQACHRLVQPCKTLLQQRGSSGCLFRSLICLHSCNKRMLDGYASQFWGHAVSEASRILPKQTHRLLNISVCAHLLFRVNVCFPRC